MAIGVCVTAIALYVLMTISRQGVFALLLTWAVLWMVIWGVRYLRARENGRRSTTHPVVRGGGSPRIRTPESENPIAEDLRTFQGAPEETLDDALRKWVSDDAAD
jgi:hypothetical protein